MRRLPGEAAVLLSALAGVLGVLAAFLGYPLLVASLFGGVVAVVLALAAVVALACFLAVELDRAAGPGRHGRAGSIRRGVTVGVLGSLTTLVLAIAAIDQDIDDDLPHPVRYAVAALAFAVVAALQWPGLPRIGGVLMTAAAVALAAHSGELEQAARSATGAAEPARPTTLADRAAAAGLTQRPWVTDVPGHHLFSVELGQVGGMAAGYVPDDRTSASAGVLVTVLPDEAVPGDDPCGSPMLPSPYGVLMTESCEVVVPGTWLRHGAGDIGMDVPGGADVVQQLDGQWVSVSAGPEVPVTLLRRSLGEAAPMTDAELDEWLTLVGLPD